MLADTHAYRYSTLIAHTHWTGVLAVLLLTININEVFYTLAPEQTAST